jgi:hypothetical protein
MAAMPGGGTLMAREASFESVKEELLNTLQRRSLAYYEIEYPWKTPLSTKRSMLYLFPQTNFSTLAVSCFSISAASSLVL